MLCSQRVFLTAVVAVTMSIFSVAHAQCVGCGSSPAIAPSHAVGGYTGEFVSGGCPGGCGGEVYSSGFSGGFAGGFSGGQADGFGYSGGGCAGGHCGSGGGIGGGGCAGGACLDKYRAGKADIAYQLDQIRAQSEKIRARNAAWPKPFSCADRQAYETIWATHYRTGQVQTCTLTDMHFDSETGDLNGLGRALVQGLMKNAPSNERNVFVYNGPGQVDYESKVRSVNSLIAEYYGHGAAQVTATRTYPRSGSGGRIEQQNVLRSEATPPPVIVIPTGTGSTSDTQVAN